MLFLFLRNLDNSPNRHGIYVEIIDCCKSDCMIEICGKLDKSNTSLKFRCVIFRSIGNKTERNITHLNLS